MNNNKKLSNLIQDYFYQRLINQRDSSPMTIATYRDTFKLFLNFAQTYLGKRIDKLELADLNSDTVLKFLDHLASVRKNGVRTRNNRLAAIHSFMQYVAEQDPTSLPIIRKVLAIPMKRCNQSCVDFLTRAEIAAIINSPNNQTWSGQRDHVLFATLYNTGARVSEIINVRVSDIDIFRAKSILLHGKGRKERTIPLWKSTVSLLKGWLKKIDNNSESFLFPNNRMEKLTRSGVEYRLLKAVNNATTKSPSLKNKRVSPHVIRHTTAMHLLEAGVDLTVVALWLGHEAITTTHHYMKADITMKEKALIKATDPKIKSYRFKPNEELLSFLEHL